MIRFVRKIALILAFAFLPLQAELHPSRIVPQVRVVNNDVVVSWTTANPTARGIVRFAPDDGRNRQPFPEYYSSAEDRSVGKSHSVTLKSLRTDIVYNYRVSCIDTVQWTELRSLNYTFRLLKQGDKHELGLILSEGPIVANATPNSIVIAWKTNLQSMGEILYWSGSKREKFSANSSGSVFEVLLEKLTADKVYSYKVVAFHRNDTVSSPVFTFRTAPVKNAKFSFMVSGDSRSGREADVDFRLNGVNYVIMNRLAQQALNHTARFFLTTGDQSDGNTPERDDMALQTETWRRAVAHANAFVPFYPSVGNHDATAPHIRFGKRGRHDPPPPNSAEDLWAENYILPTNGPEPEPGHPPFRETVYSFDYGNVHFIALNAHYFNVVKDDSIKFPYEGSFHRITGRQLEWLKADLKKAGQRLTFVYSHLPFFPAGGHIGSSFDRYPDERDALWRLFEQHNVGIVFAGHEHIYARVKVDKGVNPNFRKGIFQVIAGGAGAPTYDQDFKIPYLKNVVKFARSYNYALVTVDGNRFKMEAFDDYGKKIDEFRQ